MQYSFERQHKLDMRSKCQIAPCTDIRVEDFDGKVVTYDCQKCGKRRCYEVFSVTDKDLEILDKGRTRRVSLELDLPIKECKLMREIHLQEERSFKDLIEEAISLYVKHKSIKHISKEKI